ncbi:hypothetical protein ACBJ59_26515 [Nonomuraea sp. MTCD27]
MQGNGQVWWPGLSADVAQAVAMVRQGRSLAVDEAVRLKVVDARAPSLEAALRVADGRRVLVAGERTVTVRTADARVDRAELSFFEQVRQALANPNLAYLLLTVGILGLLYELAAPGVGPAGGIGVLLLGVALVLAGRVALRSRRGRAVSGTDAYRNRIVTCTRARTAGSRRSWTAPGGPYAAPARPRTTVTRCAS